MKVSLDIKRRALSRPRILFLIAAVALELFLCLQYYQAAHTLPAGALCVLGVVLCGAFRLQVHKLLPLTVLHGCLVSGLSVLYLLLTRHIFGTPARDLYWLVIVLNLLVFMAFTSFFYLLSGSTRFSYSASLVFLIAVELLNRFVYQFRRVEIFPSDLLSLRTGLSVVENYQPHWTLAMLESVMIVVLVLAFLWLTLEVTEKRHFRAMALAALLVQAGMLYVGLGKIDARHWDDEGTRFNGFPVNFLKSVAELSVPKPDGYSAQALADLEQRYVLPTEDSDPVPNIIVIMNESFADLRVFGDDILADQEILPYYDSLTENIIKGYALSSVYGGNTPNSEWEFLTGNTMAFLPTGAIPYQTYIRASGNHSLLDSLKAAGYRCIATHPYLASGWMRKSVYPELGFDEIHFRKDYPQEKLIRGFVSDQEMYEQVIQTYSNKQPGEKLFLFGVTMQNHGGYSIPDYKSTVHLTVDVPEGEMAEQYLSLMRESDTALETLISHFSEIPEKTVILFFGDHQPKLEIEYLEQIYGGSLDELPQLELMYKVPFFLWANFDIPEEAVECTSLNYLSNYLFRISGLPATGYTRFLTDLETAIPAMNAHGYYSAAQGTFLPYDEAEGSEAALLNDYRILQYNNIFDRKSPSSLFSPISAVTSTH